MLAESFLHAVIRDSDHVTLFRCKEEFLPTKESSWVTFAKDFYANHNKLPDELTIEVKFSIHLQPNNESPSYWLDEIKSKYKDYVIEQAVLSSAKNKSKAISIFQQAIIDANTDSDTQVIDYSDGKARAKEYKSRKGTGGITYLATNIQPFDEFSMGYKRADLWTIGGAEGSGKTWVLLRMVDALDELMLSAGKDRPILVVSGEMEAREMEERLDAIKCGLSYNKLSRGELGTIEERRYFNYLDSSQSLVRIVDSFDNLNDIEALITLYRPACCFIDGSHLLSSSYEWTDIAKVTANMKRITRNKKVPVINTTHLKSEKGRSADGGSLDDFAYTKGYTRDSDIVGVLFADSEMQMEHKIGLDWVKVRRGVPTKQIWQNNYDDCSFTPVNTNLISAIQSSATPKSNRKCFY